MKCERLFKGSHLENNVSLKTFREGQLNERSVGRESDVSPSSLHGRIQQCIHRKDLLESRKVHTLVVETGYEANAYLGSYLIRMFVQCGSLSEASSVFSKLYKPNVYAWSEILLANTNNGQSEQAIGLYHQMQPTNVKPDKCVYVAVLKACVRATAFREGKRVHYDIIESGLERNVYLTSALIDMYAKCKSLRDACNVFDEMPSDDVVVWNAMIAGYALHGHCSEALQLLQQMQQEGPQPNNRTWTAILSGYSQKGHSKDASQLFQQMSYEGFETNVVSWNALISGFVLNRQSHEALSIFYRMMYEGSEPDRVTYMSVLKACANIVDFQHGKVIHDLIITDEETSVAVETTLIDMYAKCGSLEDARDLFEKLSVRDVVVWNSLIAGYVLYGFCLDALQLFQRMQKEGVMADNATILSILKVCSLISASISGKLIHSIAIESGTDADEFVSSCLIDMYAECGSFKDAYRVFDRMPKVDIVGWNALIAGYAVQGNYPSVYQVLEGMQARGLAPDGVTFISLLSACSSTGSIGDGSNILNSMREIYGITPTDEHYGCMVDLLGGAGCLIEAEDLLHVVPRQPMVVPWTSLLNSCRVHNDVDLAEHCFEHVMDIDEGCASAYTLLSIIYSTAGMVNDLGKIKAMKQQSNAWKKPGRAYIELDGVVHGFVVGDNLHAQSDAIYEKLGFLLMQLKEQGHVWHF